MTAGARGEGRGEGIQCVRCDTGTMDRVQNGAEGDAVRGPSANGIQCLFLIGPGHPSRFSDLFSSVIKVKQDFSKNVPHSFTT